MTELALVILDASLLSAVMEQVQAADLGLGVAHTDLAQAYRDDHVALILIDEAAWDAKAAKSMPDQRENLTKPVLLLGKTHEHDLLFTERIEKPFRLGQMMARLHYHLKTVPRLRSQVITFGGLRFEAQNRQIVVEASGTVIRLTEKETALLAFLGQSPTPVARDELLAAVWGYDSGIDTHTLETHIYQLRRKLDSDGKNAALLVNEQGAYRLER